MDLRKKFKNNIFFAFGAQTVSMLMSIMMSLFVPKLLNVTNFGYWQLFIFYYGYVGFFHFGLNDGVYLKYGGVEYNKLDKDLIGSQFKMGAFFQSIFALLIMLFAFFFIKDNNRQFVLYATAIVLVINNVALYLGYVFQACNETKLFSISVIIDKLIFLITLLFFLVVRVDDFRVYVCLYLFSKTVSLLYCMYKGKEIVFCKCLPFLKTLFEMTGNIKIGINLMLANIASTLIIGSARFIIDGKWGIEMFGQFSLSISMINFVLLFLGQVSMVLFPMLRQVDEKNQSKFYLGIRDALSLFLPLAFVAYIPLRFALGLWLPQYDDSLVFWGILLPICTFNGKMNLLCITYLKVFRKEKSLLYINLVSMVVSCIFAWIGAYVFNSILAVAVLLVLSIALRSFVSEVYVANIMKFNITKDIILETLMVCVFMSASYFLKNHLWYAFGVTLLAYALFVVLNYKKLNVLKMVLKRK